MLLDIKLIRVWIVRQMKHHNQSNVRFVEGKEEVCEDLRHGYIERLVALVECNGFHINHNPRAKNLIPPKDQPDHEPGIDLPKERNLELRETGYATEGVLKCSIGAVVELECALLLGG